MEAEKEILSVTSEEKSEAPNLEQLQQRLSDLQQGLSQASLELASRSHGHMFSCIRSISAKELLGEDWRKMIEPLVANGETPADVNLAGIYSELPLSKSFQKGKRITINTLAGDEIYNGTHPILHIDEHVVTIPVVRRGAASGMYINTDKVESAQRKVVSFEGRINKLQMEIDTLMNPPRLELLAVEEEQETKVAIEELLRDAFKPKKQQHSFKPLLIGIAVAIGAATILYFVLSEKEIA